MADDRPDSVKKALELFMRIDRMHRRAFENNVVHKLGIHRSQHMMLMNISRFGSCSQKDIATRLDISPAAAAVTLKKLETGGFIKRKSCGGDSRVKMIVLTPKGQDIVNETRRLADEINRQMFCNVDENEINMLTECLLKMQSNLNEVAQCAATEPLKG